MLRPDPFPLSPSSAIRTTGRRWRSTRREATIPITPGVPALAREHVRGALSKRGDLRFGLQADARLHLPALVVGAVQLLGDLPRRARVLGQDQLEPRVGAVQAPRGVQARRQREADRRARSPSRDRPRRPPSARAAPAWSCSPARAARGAPACGSRPPAAPRRRSSPAPRGRGPRSSSRLATPTGGRATAPARACRRRPSRTAPGRDSRRRAGARSARRGSTPSARGAWWSVTTTSIPSALAARPPRRR